MLGMFGLLGAVLAGLAIDGLFGSLVGKSDGDDEETNPDAAGNSADAGFDGNLLDWLGLGTIGDDGPDTSAGTGPDDPDYVPLSHDGQNAADLDVVLQGSGQDDMLTGRGGDDSLMGGGHDDQLVGRSGNDFLQGGDGSDVAYGGTGEDTLQGGAGEDMLSGDDGDDRLVGGSGADTLLGHEGADSLYGGAGVDTLIGGGGDDSLVGGDANDWLAGGLDNDSLIGDGGRDEMDGGAGNDVLDGREAQNAFPEMDFLNGGGGDDTLIVGAGDHATGGEGADLFELSDMAPNGEIAHISDYKAGEDSLVVVFDPLMHPDPHLSLETAEDTQDVVVVLDGVPLAIVQGGAGLTLDDVLLTPAQAA